MTPFQTALRAYFVASAALATYSVDGNTRTLASWRDLGNATLLHQVANDVEFGAALGLTVGQSLVPSSDVRAAIAAAADYAQLSAAALAQLEFPISAEPFDMGNAGLVTAVENVLTSHLGAESDALAAFQALTLRGASIAQHVAAEVGLANAATYAASMDDINATL